MKNTFLILAIGFIFSSCKERVSPDLNSSFKEISEWSNERLDAKAMDHLDSNNWDKKLFQQDLETFEKYPFMFQSYPLKKSPFPVAEYDYAVSSFPFTIEWNKQIIKGVRIGEYKSPDSEKITDKLTLMILTNNKESEESSQVESRNFPYLTAQGFFKVSNQDYDWVFSASPDGFSALLVNMKFFDLRFGETIIIYPQEDNSFFYDQIKDSPNHYESFQEFESAILNNERVKRQLIK